MTKLLKDLFKNEKKLGKFFAIITMVALVTTVLSPGAFAAFWRTLSGGGPYSVTTDQPNTLKYGYGYGSAGWGYGYGYAYNVYNDSGYYYGFSSASSISSGGITSSYATVTGTSTAATSVEMSTPVSFSSSSATITIPDNTVITSSDGTFDPTAITASVGTATATTVGGTVAGSINFGATGEKLLFSVPVQLVIPISGVSNDSTVNIVANHYDDDGYNSLSLSTSSSATCSAGVATPSSGTATVSGGYVTIYTCAASSFAAYTPSTPSGGSSSSSSSSGGGGGGTYMSPSDSNSVTSLIASTIKSVVDRIRTISRPMQILASYMIETASGLKAKLTNAKGIITLKPNRDSTIWAIIPADTWVTGSKDWDGKIMPPLVKKKTLISKSGETVTGTSYKLKRDDVDEIIKVGSYTSELAFTNPVTLAVPVDLANGTAVNILYSADGNKWKSIGNAKVSDGKVGFESSHFSYFVLSSALADAAGMSTSTIESTVTQVTGVFQDITNHWARNYIQNIADLGIVSGKTPTRFAPDDNITRAELTKIALNAFGYAVAPSVSTTTFKDVDADAWYAPYIVAARNAGVIQGYGDGSFSPNGSVNRAEALKILIEAGGFNGVDSNYESNYESKSGWAYVFFPDVKIGQWFAKYVAYAKDFGVVGGYSDGNFRPGNPITRAEVAKVVTKLLEMKE